MNAQLRVEVVGDLIIAERAIASQHATTANTSVVATPQINGVIACVKAGHASIASTTRPITCESGGDRSSAT